MNAKDKRNKRATFGKIYDAFANAVAKQRTFVQVGTKHMLDHHKRENKILGSLSAATPQICVDYWKNTLAAEDKAFRDDLIAKNKNNEKEIKKAKKALDKALGK